MTLPKADEYRPGQTNAAATWHRFATLPHALEVEA